MHINDFTVGDILEMKQVSKTGIEYRTAIVTAVITTPSKEQVNFIGHCVDERMETGSGAFVPSDVGTKPYGFYCAVRIIGKGSAPHYGPIWYPKPGNPGYDLMC